MGNTHRSTFNHPGILFYFETFVFLLVSHLQPLERIPPKVQTQLHSSWQVVFVSFSVLFIFDRGLPKKETCSFFAAIPSVSHLERRFPPRNKYKQTHTHTQMRMRGFWLKIKPPENRMVLVLTSFGQGNPFWGYPSFAPLPNAMCVTSTKPKEQREQLMANAAEFEEDPSDGERGLGFCWKNYLTHGNQLAGIQGEPGIREDSP